MLEVYRSLQGLLHDLKGSVEEWDPHSIHMQHVRSSAVLQLITDLKELVKEIIEQ